MKLPSLKAFYLRRLVLSPKAVSMELGGLREEPGAEQPVSYDVHLVFSGVTGIHFKGCFAPGARITNTSGLAGETEHLGHQTYSLDAGGGQIIVSAQQLAASAYVVPYSDAARRPI